MPIGLVLDSRDPEALAPFWAAALGYVVAGSVENYVLLLPDGREGPKLLLQRVPEPKADKNRMHLDIEAADIEGRATQLEALGATLPDSEGPFRARLPLDRHGRPGRQRVLPVPKRRNMTGAAMPSGSGRTRTGQYHHDVVRIVDGWCLECRTVVPRPVRPGRA